MNVEILVFGGVEDLDVFGPMSVLAHAGAGVALAAEGGPRQVRTAQGTELIAGAPGKAPDLLLVPGGGWISRSEHGAWAEAQRGLLPALIAESFAAGRTIAAVCTGSMLLAAAGVLKGRPAVTHHSAMAELAAAGARVIGDARVVDDGQIVTAGGITAGLDLGLWLVQRYLGPAQAATVAAGLEYARTGYVWQHQAAESLVPADAGFPQTRLAKVADELARAAEPDYIYNHSARSYLFARVAASVRGFTAGEDYDEELVFLSCILHDIGLTGHANRGRRFEVDGAEAAVDLMRANGLATARAEILWEAIALHTSAGIAEFRANEIALTRAGIAMDFGGEAELVPGELAKRAHDRYPRLDMARCLADAIVAQARDNPQKAPPYTLPGELARERAADRSATRLERGAIQGRWGS
ncbi:MAG TPA: DJ-1/PfpI family protein [Streptosporangiaceae bacterium]|jgi:putative intracellular protease/amidase|nr:DJ-1/PfpI family protein [Streptosporangiaceae bacterium]